MKKNRSLISLVIAFCLLTSGCVALVAAGAAGGAGAVYYGGWLTDQISADVPTTFEASKAGLRALNLPINKAHYDQIKANVGSELSDGTNVYVKMKATEGGTTEIKVRVGTFGDKDASFRILRAIKQNI